MANYHRTSAPSRTLKEHERAINTEEAGGAKFVENRIVPIDNKPTNLLEFQEIDDGGLPEEIELKLKDDPPPAGKERVFDGQFIVSGTIRSVRGYRPSV